MSRAFSYWDGRIGPDGDRRCVEAADDRYPHLVAEVLRDLIEELASLRHIFGGPGAEYSDAIEVLTDRAEARLREAGSDEP